MCLVAVAFRASERYPFILAANRDELHARPTAPAGWWADQPNLLGGRDLEAGGTWLAMTRNGRLAAVTNIFEPGAVGARSRGLLVTDFLGSALAPLAFARTLALDSYRPFYALLLADDSLGLVSNRAAARQLDDGVHVFSNNVPGTQWPKLGVAREAIEALLSSEDPEPALFDLLAERAGPRQSGNTRRRKDSRSAWVRQSVFVEGEEFGTRCSTVVLVDRRGRVKFTERRFDNAARPAGVTELNFELQPARG